MCSVVMAEGVHPIPFRTRKLSPPAPMVLRRRPWESRTSLSTSDGSLLFPGDRPRRAGRRVLIRRLTSVRIVVQFSLYGSGSCPADAHVTSRPTTPA